MLLGGLRRKNGQPEYLSHQRLNHPALSRQAPADVVSPSTTREVPHQAVNDHVPQPRVEAERLLRVGAGGYYGNVGDAAVIQGDRSVLLVAQQQIVHEEDERGTLASRRKVSGVEVGHYSDTRPRCDDRWLTDL